MSEVLLLLIREVAAYFMAFMNNFFAQRADDPNLVTFTMDSINLIESLHADWPWTEKLKAVVEGWDEGTLHYKGSLDYAKEVGLDITRAIAVTSASLFHQNVMGDIASGKRSLTQPVLTSLIERTVPISSQAPPPPKKP